MSVEQRKHGEAEELDFWRKYLGKSGLFWPHEFQFRTDPESLLQEAIRPYLENVPGKRIRILDVGSGPLTILGKRLPGREVEITAVDCLAEEYGKLLEEFQIAPLIPVEKLAAEALRTRFAPESFDFVFSRNAIDHCENPLAALHEMVHLTRPGCRTMVCVFPDEAERANYTGLHQWNFRLEGDRLYLWNRSERIDVLDALSNFVELEQLSEDQQITLVLRKLVE